MAIACGLNFRYLETLTHRQPQLKHKLKLTLKTQRNHNDHMTPTFSVKYILNTVHVKAFSKIQKENVVKHKPANSLSDQLVPRPAGLKPIILAK